MCALPNRYLYDTDVSFGPVQDTWATQKMEKSWEAIDSISKLIPDRKVAKALASLLAESYDCYNNSEIVADFFNIDKEQILALGDNDDEYIEYLSEEEQYRREQSAVDYDYE